MAKLLAVELSLLYPAEHEKHRLVSTCIHMVRDLRSSGVRPASTWCVSCI